MAGTGGCSRRGRQKIRRLFYCPIADRSRSCILKGNIGQLFQARVTVVICTRISSVIGDLLKPDGTCQTFVLAFKYLQRVNETNGNDILFLAT